MYKTVRIKNFRAFQTFTIEPLERVNLVLGKNNVGKTALLEALFLLLGTNNPELSLRINIFRGLDRFPSRPDDVWGWLFHDRKVHDEVMIEAIDDRKALPAARPPAPAEVPTGPPPFPIRDPRRSSPAETKPEWRSSIRRSAPSTSGR